MAQLPSAAQWLWRKPLPKGVAPKAARPQAPALPLPSELQLPRAGRWPPTGSAMAAKARRSR